MKYRKVIYILFVFILGCATVKEKRYFREVNEIEPFKIFEEMFSLCMKGWKESSEATKLLVRHARLFTMFHASNISKREFETRRDDMSALKKEFGELVARNSSEYLKWQELTPPKKWENCHRYVEKILCGVLEQGENYSNVCLRSAELLDWYIHQYNKSGFFDGHKIATRAKINELEKLNENLNKTIAKAGKEWLEFKAQVNTFLNTDEMQQYREKLKGKR